MLEVSIKKKLGNFALDVSFSAENEVMALLGASGCGKSMTLKCIAGIEKPDSGRIVLGDRVLFDTKEKINLSPQERRVGYLFQQFALFPNMTVYQNVAAGVRLRNKSAAHEMLKRMRLDGFEDKYPRQLSGGQQQRVALARILVNEPELLMLDEPFTALDSYLKWQLELELSDALKGYGGPVLFVSHDRDEVYRLCGSVCVLNAGSSETKREVRNLFSMPQTLSAALLSGCKNFTRIRKLSDDRFVAADWGVTLYAPAPDWADYAGVRAHYLKPCATGGPNVLPCKVDRVVDNLFSTIVMLSTPGGCEGNSRLRMELPQETWNALESPETLQILIDPNDILFLRKNDHNLVMEEK